MKNWVKHWSLRKQLLVVLALAGICATTVFCTLWGQEYRFWLFCQRFPSISWDEKAFVQTLRERAKDITIPDEGESDPKLDAFFELRDDYTAVNLYSLEDGGFLCGAMPRILQNVSYRGLFDLGYSVTSGRAEQYYSEILQFQNGKVEVVLYSYHRIKTVYPYFAACLVLSILTFLFPVLRFIHRKMRYILRLKENILTMAAGNLTQPVADCGGDEIGILAQELDRLRLALDENIRLETQSRKANQDLIAAMSHDLRTPLTILTGYLEILKLGHGDPALHAEYLERCLRKTQDLKAMTDKMFEYALVFSDHIEPNFAPLAIVEIQKDLSEHCDFMQLAGFIVHRTLEPIPGEILADETMLKRVFVNLFSNILKYGDKQTPVSIGCLVEQARLKISFSNGIQPHQEKIESNRIGLKSAQEILALHHGSLEYTEEAQMFWLFLSLPMQENRPIEEK
ncbi:MAG: HAMP domain-containing sensor histidine kinase [Butyricicoccus sp.]|nr:HAMP domain-containing sensor histidine kinase [Butyricicoccus sp.]